MNTNVIYYNNDISLVQSMQKRKNIYEKLSEAGRHRDVDWETNA